MQKKVKKGGSHLCFQRRNSPHHRRGWINRPIIQIDNNKAIKIDRKVEGIIPPALLATIWTGSPNQGPIADVFQRKGKICAYLARPKGQSISCQFKKRSLDQKWRILKNHPLESFTILLQKQPWEIKFLTEHKISKISCWTRFREKRTNRFQTEAIKTRSII